MGVYLVGVAVILIVVVAGTLRYELQKDVAGAPSAFTTPRTPVTALQLTARAISSSPGWGRAFTWVLPQRAIVRERVKGVRMNFMVPFGIRKAAWSEGGQRELG